MIHIINVHDENLYILFKSDSKNILYKYIISIFFPFNNFFCAIFGGLIWVLNSLFLSDYNLEPFCYLFFFFLPFPSLCPSQRMCCVHWFINFLVRIQSAMFEKRSHVAVNHMKETGADKSGILRQHKQASEL